MIPFAPFIYEKSKEEKKEPLPLFIEETPYFEPPVQEEQDEAPYIIIIDIL